MTRPDTNHYPKVRTPPVVNNICISMVKNEQDIIEPFIRHNIGFFDLFFVLDNKSTDHTREILIQCAREFPTLCVTDIPHAQYDQSTFMSNALHFIQGACFADFVAFLDADEFIESKDRSAFDRGLRRIPVGQFGRMPWKTLLPNPNTNLDQNGDFLERLSLQRRTENPQYEKGIYRAGGKISKDIQVEQGNHGFKYRDGDRLPSIALEDISLLHVPIRTSNQTLAKGKLGWKAAQKREGSDPDDAFQWKRLSQLHSQGITRLSPSDLLREAAIYAQAKVPKTLSDNMIPWAGRIEKKRAYSSGKSASLKTLLSEAAPNSAETYTPQFPERTKQASSPRGTAFDDQWHRDTFFLDIPPLQYFVEKYEVSSCLDVGCGSGAALDFMKHFGVDHVRGLDGIDTSANLLSNSEYLQVDLTKPFDLKEKYDLVMCLEVVEHLPPDQTRKILHKIQHHATEHILFSVAEPGQPGNQHINCMAIGETLDLWAELGWYPNLLDTFFVRALSSLSWFRRNLIVLERITNPLLRPNDQVLRDIGRLQYIWYDQPVGIRRFPFNDLRVPGNKGYQ